MNQEPNEEEGFGGTERAGIEAEEVERVVIKSGEHR